MSEPVVLGIESSCDETGVGIVRGDEILAHVVASSVAEHVPFGGVIPEIASRAHSQALVPSLGKALQEAHIGLDEIDALAVTAGPGLAGALLVGTCGAQALAAALGKPLYGVNHLVAHISVAFLNVEHTTCFAPGEQFAALLISGGHTDLFSVRGDALAVELLGTTLDDAVGETFDKVARVLGLPYPGGPEIERLACEGDPHGVAFPRGLSAPKYMGTKQHPGEHRYNFSFSGLKTAVARYVDQHHYGEVPIDRGTVAASFQEAACQVLAEKAVLACQERGLQTLLLGGGVAANSRMRVVLAEKTRQAGLTLAVPPRELCTDNGVMVASLGARLLKAGVGPSPLDFAPDSSLAATTVRV